MDYFFSAQIRQYRLQIIRAFSNFSVSMGQNADGSPRLRQVPCRYGDSTRLAETIITGNSENKIPTAPFISVYVTSMALSPERRAAPSLVSTVNVNERAYDGTKYLDTPGNRYTVKRYTPVPFLMTLNVDFWCANLNQKEELFEQTQVLFNGMVDMQTSNNPLDWTLFSTIEPTNITWSSRSIPIGTENPIDVMTIEYRVPIWINPPAQVTYQKVIEQIVSRIHDSSPDAQQNWEWSASDLLTEKITTPDQAQIKLTLVDDFTYEISLCDQAFVSHDAQQLPTIIQGVQNPILSAGDTFAINNVAITIPNTNMMDLIQTIKQALQGTPITVQLLTDNQLQFTHVQAGDITFANVTGTPVEQLGFVAHTYPGGDLAWWRLLAQYGAVRNQLCGGQSQAQLFLLTSEDLDNRTADVKGTFVLHPTNQNLIVWQVDPGTWPALTQPDIQAVIDPHKTWPGSGLPEPVMGQRYLIVTDLAETSLAWGPVQAVAQDIIEYDGATWFRSWSHADSDQPQLVKNAFSGKWYRFEQGAWQVWPTQASVGMWRLKL